jgi:phage terminase small subunit
MSPRQRRFVEEYLLDLNATQAAIRAGYNPRTAGRYAHALLKKQEIAAALAEAQAQLSERTRISIDRVVTELARVGFSNLRRAFDHNGNLLRPEAWDDATAAAISSVKVATRNLGDGEVEYVHEIKLWPKTAALDQLAKHLGRPAAIPLPPIEDTAAMAAIASSLFRAVVSGQLPTSEAAELGKLLELHRRVTETAELEERVRKLEEPAR